MGLTMPYLGERIDALRGALAWTLMVAALLVLTALASLIVGAIFVAIRFYQWDMFWPRFVINWVISLIIGFSITLYQGFRGEIDRTKLKLRTQELEKERALKLASEAQLASLQSRLQPHFLFNTLNSISALIQENPERADLMLQRLAALLRFSLDSQAGSVVLLRREMRIVVDYLEIEHTRFGDRLQYDLDIPPALEDCEVPPMAVQTLVENCVKHAISPCRAGGAIHIAALSRDAVLELAVWDNGPGFDSESIVAGHGLDNLRTRLSVLFGEMGTLRIAQRGEHTAVVLAMPLRMAPAEVAR